MYVFSFISLQVKLAAQVMSSSVAKSLELASALNIDGFQDVKGTVYFIKTIDHLFDALNSRTPFGKGFKAPINPTNFSKLIAFFREVENLFHVLQYSNEQLISTNKATGFVGFLLCMKSIEQLVPLLFQSPVSPFKYVLAYKFSQDHVELFFNAIRGHLGWNNNPSAVQFRFVYRRMLSRSGIVSFSDGNCVNFSNDDEEKNDSVFEEVDFLPPSSFVSNVIVYIAGFVVRSVSKRMDCDECKLSLLSSNVPSATDGDFLLLSLKNNGGLILPSKDTITLLKRADFYFRLMPQRKQTERYVLPRVLCDSSISTLFSSDHHLICDHRDRLLRSLIISFCKLRSFHIARQHNFSFETVRNRLNKTILFRSN